MPLSNNRTQVLAEAYDSSNIERYMPDRLFSQRVKRFVFSYEIVRWVCRPFTDVPNDTHKWVFILGCYNSGTTLLHDLIAAHPECASLPAEGAVLTSQLPTPEQFGWTRMWWRVYDDMSTFVREIGGNANTVVRDWSIHYDLRKKILLEKSISNASRIDWLNRNFPDAKYIFIVRNGYAVSEGIRRKTASSKSTLPLKLAVYPIEWCAKQWAFTNKIIELGVINELDEDNVLRIRYEDLCMSPYQHMQIIEKFLDLRANNNPELSKVKNMNKRSFDVLSSQEYTQINLVAEDMLRKYNYEIV